MDIGDLAQFAVLARTQHVRQAAEELSLSPSAISKMLQRLEQATKTRLFDRVGRGLKLNSEGVRLLQRCQPLLSEFEQLRAEFLGLAAPLNCRLAGPALLQLHWGREIARHVADFAPQGRIHFGNQNERQAVFALEQGEADLALVTSAVQPQQGAAFASLPLGRARFALAVGEGHPLREGGQDWAPLRKVLTFPFVVPARAHFQILAEGPATDGWRDDLYPRQILYRSDDLLLVDGLVRRNQALAYLPDYVIQELGLMPLAVPDCPYDCDVMVCLWYRPSRAEGWMNRLIQALSARGTAAETGASAHSVALHNALPVSPGR